MEILLDVVWLILGLALLYFGAEWLVGGAAKISVKYGISPLVVGLTVVAFGTSAPELFVSLGFNLSSPPRPDMAIGNVIGSNICNIGLVLGVSAFICVLNIKSDLLIRDMPFLIAVSLGFSAMLLLDQKIARWEGIVLFVVVVAFTIFQLRASKKEDNPEVIEEFEAEFGKAEEFTHDPVWKLAGLVLIGLIVLYFGAEYLEKGGVGLAERIGVPGAVISLTVIAFSTSVPELATSVVASMKREGDIITGNVIGSCLFNLLCVIGITATVKPMEVSDIETVDLVVMLGFTLFLLPLMWTRRRVSRWEGSALLIGYIAYCIYLWNERAQIGVA
ncbi:MAG: calcium/sodium antiporter [Verrucomicrobiales bacterium]|nr:calcium/sodium antiporter [Verrucomicrobiales bacterium]